MLTNLELFIEGFYFNKMSKRKLITILTKENSGHIFDNNGHYLRRELYSDFQFAGYDKELEILYDYYMFLKTLPADELFPEGIFKNKKSVSVSNNRRYVFSNYVANGMNIIVFRRLFTTEFDSAENGNLKQLFDDFMKNLIPLVGNKEEDKQIISNYFYYYFQNDESLYKLDRRYKNILDDEYLFVQNMKNYQYISSVDYPSYSTGKKFGL